MHRIRGYIIWFIATLFVVYAFCLNTASAVFFDAIKKSLATSNTGVSVATGAFIFGFALMQIPAGYLLDKFNARPVVSVGVFLLALGSLLISYTDNLLLFVAYNFIQGIGASFAFIAVAVLISQWFPKQKFPVLFGLTQTVCLTLVAVLHFYFTLALSSHSWNYLYKEIAIFGALLLILTMALVKSPDNYKRAASPSLYTSLFAALKNGQIILCSLAAATSFGVLLAYAGLWYLKVQTFYAVENLQAVIISGLIFVGAGLGTPLWGWLSNRVRSRVAVIHVTLCLGTMALLLDLYLPHFAIHTLLITWITSFFTGFFLSGSMLFYTLASELSDNTTRGVTISVVNTAVFLFNTLMQFIPWLFITEFSTEYFTYLWTLPFFILISILMLYFIKDTLSK